MTRKTRRMRKTRKARRAGPVHSHVHNFLPQRVPALTRGIGKRNLRLVHFNNKSNKLGVKRNLPQNRYQLNRYNVGLNPKESQIYAELFSNYGLDKDEFLSAVDSYRGINLMTRLKLKAHFLATTEDNSGLNNDGFELNDSPVN